MYVALLFSTIAIITTVAVDGDGATPQKSLDVSVKALEYLGRFGYYRAPDSRLGTLANEEDIRKSIRSLQWFAGLEQTGYMDDATKNLLETDRCGMADMVKNLNNRRKRRYTHQGTKWNKNDLTWKLVNDNNDGLSRAQVEATMDSAFKKWQVVTNLNFRKLDYTSTEAVDIEVKFVRNYHQDAYPFDGPGGTLAHAFYPHNNQGISGDVHFDDDEVFTIGKKTGRSLLWVAVHEIGHSIGLEHSNMKEAIMYPWYRGNEGKDFNLNLDDITGIQYLYGSRVGPTIKTNTPKTESSKRTTASTTTTKQVTASCTGVMKTSFLDKSTGLTYVINDDKVYKLGKALKIESGPTLLKTVFPGLDRADSAYRRTDGRIVLFKGKQYFIYDSVSSRQLMETGVISNKYTGVPSTVTKIDAAFVWSGNGRTYLFTGDKYYRYDEWRQNVDPYYPRSITANWKGVPSHVDSVFVWSNGVTYFFKGGSYYRFNNKDVKVEKNYPKSIEKYWTQCAAGLTGEAGSDGVAISSNIYSTVFSLVTIALVKLLH